MVGDALVGDSEYLEEEEEKESLADPLTPPPPPAEDEHTLFPLQSNRTHSLYLRAPNFGQANAVFNFPTKTKQLFKH